MMLINEKPSSAGETLKAPLHRELQVATDLARNSGALLLRRQKEEIDIRYKANAEIVTNADLESNEIICKGLASAFPADGIFSEEGSGTFPASYTRLWIVDPLDSTSNFAGGGDEFSISIGLAVAGEAVLGVVYNPVRDELFTGCQGFGASLNRMPVRTSYATAQGVPRLLVSSKEWNRGLRRSAGDIVLHPMASMAYKMARVAAGMEDAVLSLKQRKPWGTCAGTALVLAAGGRVSTLDGTPLRFTEGRFHGLVASCSSRHDEVLKLARLLNSEMKAHKTA